MHVVSGAAYAFMIIIIFQQQRNRTTTVTKYDAEASNLV